MRFRFLAVVVCFVASLISGSAAQSASCALSGVKQIGPGTGPDWSAASGLIAYFLQDTAGVYQIYTMRPDGSQNQCLTCAGVEGAPAANLHKGSPSWDPTGKYILFQAEIPNHPLGISKLLAAPGAGWWNDLWLMTADGKQFWQLTNYGARTNSGVLVPRFSRDGARVFWAQLVAFPIFSSGYKTGQFGRWRMNVADFSLRNGSAQILNMRAYTPGNGLFYESQDWSPDGSTVVFATDINVSGQNIFNIFSLNLNTRRLVNLTNTPSSWNEQATYSPGGGKIAFMSSRGTNFSPSNLSSLQAELFLMDADGANVTQISHFNTSGFPGYTPGKLSIATKDAWNPDGTQILQEQHFAGQPSMLWMFTFAGPCGAGS